MDNVVDALKIAFALFVFAFAIMVTFGLVSQAKSTADTVLYYSDETNFYEQSKSSSTNRVVSVSEIIPNLYRYYEESIGIIINLENGEDYMFDLNNREDIVIEGKTQLISEADRQANLDEFIKTKLPSGTDVKFKEEFVEVPISGIYEYGSDGAELVISQGGKKVYITYTEQ